MKKIILFTGGVETLDYFSIQLAESFEQMDYRVFLFDLQKEETSYDQLLKFHEKGNTVMVTFNFTGIRGDEIFINEQGMLFWDIHHIPCYNIVVDHPFYYHELIRRRPKQYEQFCIDKDHLNYMKRFFPEVALGPFLPLAGTELPLEYGCLPMADRPIDIIFTGNYTPPHSFDKHITRLDEEYTSFYHTIIDALIAEPDMTMEEAFELHLKKEMPELSEEDLKLCMENMIFIDLYVRFYFRGLVVKTLADHGFQIHVFGKGWKLLNCEHPENIIDGDSLDSLGCLQKISQAKISLNIMPWFKAGAHDRIFNSMLNGALCLTDTSRYLTEELQDGKEVCYYSLKGIDQLPAIVGELLKHPGTMERMAKAGYWKARQSHTWGDRARVLEQRFEPNR